MNEKRNFIKLKIDFRIVSAVLLAVIIAMMFLWNPWSDSKEERTIQVSGDYTSKAEPDKFTFYPNYEFTSASKDDAISKLTAKNKIIIDTLKSIGVKDSQIKSNVDSNDYAIYYKESSNTPTYNLRITVDLDDKAIAQKVQDYLITTTPSGAITPYLSFSTNKQKNLESQARDEATKDARKKADQSAKNLGFRLGKVKSVVDGTGFNPIPVLYGKSDSTSVSNNASAILSLQPGENEINYTVTVVYYIN